MPQDDFLQTASEADPEPELAYQPPDTVNADRARAFLQRRGQQPGQITPNTERARKFLQSRQSPEEGFTPPERQQEESPPDQRDSLKRRAGILRKRERQLADRIDQIKKEADKDVIIDPASKSTRIRYNSNTQEELAKLEERRENLRQQRLDINSLLTSKEVEDKGYTGIISESLTIAKNSIERIVSVDAAKEAFRFVDDMNAIDKGELKVPEFNPRVPYGGVGPDPRMHVLAEYQSLDEEGRAAMKKDFTKKLIDNVKETENLTEKIKEVSDTDIGKEMFGAETIPEAVDFFLSAPLETVMSVGFQSLAYMVPGIIGGAIGGFAAGPAGAAVGVGIGSGGMDFYANMTERFVQEAMNRADMSREDVLQEVEAAGIDTSGVYEDSIFYGKDSWMIPRMLKNNDDSDLKKGLLSVFADDEFTREATKQAALHGAAVGSLDAAGAFIPAKTITSILYQNASGLSAKAAARLGTSFAAGMFIDASAGAGGEAVGQLLADGKIKPGEVTAEFVGEFFGAPAQIIGDVVAIRAGQKTNQSVAEQYQQRALEIVNGIRKQGKGFLKAPKQPNIKRLGRYLQLSERPKTLAEKQAYQYVLSSMEEYDQNYTNEVNEQFDTSKGNVVSADVGKVVIPGYDASKSAVYHEPASGFAKLKYEELLADEGTQQQDVVIMSGGSGAGKSTSLRLEGSDLNNVAAVYDTNLNSYNSAERKIEKALESGREVQIQHVYREPVEAFQNGVLKRAIKGEGGNADNKRIVPVDAHVATHVGARRTLEQLVEKYGDNDNVNFVFVDNSRGKGNATIVESLQDLPDFNLSENVLRQIITTQVQNAYLSRQISKNERDTFTGARQAAQQDQGSQGRDQSGPSQQGGPQEGQSGADGSRIELSERTGLNEGADGQIVVPLSPRLDTQVDQQTRINSIENFGRTYRQNLPENEDWTLKFFDDLFDLNFSRKPTGDQLTAQELVRQRRADIDIGQLESAKFRTDLRQRHSNEELTALTFILEKTNAPDQLTNRDEIQQLIDHPTESMQQTVNEVRGYLDEAHEMLMEFYGDDLGFIEDYVPHIWDIPENRMGEVQSWFATQNPSVKKRLIPTIKKGIDELGLAPKSINIADLLAIYDETKHKTLANLKFIESLMSMTDEYGEPMVKRYDKAPADWVNNDHPLLQRAMAISSDEDVTVLMKRPVRVHPQIAGAVKSVLDEGFNNKFFKNLEKVNGTIKKSWLTISLFHHIALAEVGMSTPGMFAKTAKIAAKGMGRGIQGLFQPKRVMQKILEDDGNIFKNLDIARDAIQHGLQLGAISDVHRDQVGEVLQGLEDKFSGTQRLFKGLKERNEAWDAALWDYMHNTLKLMAYETVLQDNMNKFPEASTKQLKLETAQFVNDTFGGQNWDTLLASKKFQQSLHLMILSPDWLLSTMRQALSPLGIGSVTKGKTARQIRRSMGRGFWVRAGVYFYGTMNMLNATITMNKYGEARFMWDNDPGEKTNLQICNYPDGTKKYLRWGKQFRELGEFVIDPAKKMAAKLSPIVQETVKQFSGKSLTGFPTSFAEQGFWESIVTDGPGGHTPLPNRIEHLLSMPIPFSIKQQIQNGEVQPLSLAFPVGRGLTPYSTRELFQRAISEADQSFVSEIAHRASENNLKVDELFDQAVSSIKSNRKYELRQQYGVDAFEKTPQSVQAGYTIWERQIDAFTETVEGNVELYARTRRR